MVKDKVAIKQWRKRLKDKGINLHDLILPKKYPLGRKKRLKEKSEALWDIFKK